MKRKQIPQLLLWCMLMLGTLGVSPLGAFAQDDQASLRNRKIDPERKKALLEKIEELKYNRLKDALKLDNASAQQFFEKYKPAEKDIQDLVKQRNEAVRKLHGLTKGEQTDAEVDPTLENIRSLNRKIEDRVVNLDKELKPILTPRQRARLLVFEQEFNRKLRDHAMRPKPEPGNPSLREKIKEKQLEKRRQYLEDVERGSKEEDRKKRKGRKR